jgi:hypothetical protein
VEVTRGEEGKNDKFKLLDLIRNYKKYSFNYNIYVQNEYKIDPNMKCLLVDDDEIQENIISFDNAIFKYLVNIDVIYSVIDNLNQQQQNPSDEEYIFAFKHYIENDAFIDLERAENAE